MNFRQVNFVKKFLLVLLIGFIAACDNVGANTATASSSSAKSSIASIDTNNITQVVGAYGEIYNSNDNGITWENTFFANTDFRLVAASDGYILIGGNRANLLISGKNNTEFTPLKLPVGDIVKSIVAMRGGVFLILGGNGQIVEYDVVKKSTRVIIAELGALDTLSVAGDKVIASGNLTSYLINTADGNKIKLNISEAIRQAVLNVFDNCIYAIAGNKVYSSRDGDNWQVEYSGDSPLTSIAVSNNNQLIVGSDSGQIITRIANDKEIGEQYIWEARQVSGSKINSCEYNSNSGNFIAVGEHGAIFVSSDGLLWNTAKSITTSYNLNSVVAVDNQDIVVGDAGRIFVGQQGFSSFYRVSQGTENSFTSVAYNYDARQFIAVGNSGSVYLNKNNLWIPQKVDFVNNLIDVIYDEGKYTAVGTNGAILDSIDGKEWVPQDKFGGGVSENYSAIAARNGFRVVVGARGVIRMNYPSTNGYYSLTDTSRVNTNISSVTAYSDIFYAVDYSGELIEICPQCYDMKNVNIIKDPVLYGQVLRAIASDNDSILIGGNNGKLYFSSTRSQYGVPIWREYSVGEDSGIYNISVAAKGRYLITGEHGLFAMATVDGNELKVEKRSLPSNIQMFSSAQASNPFQLEINRVSPSPGSNNFPLGGVISVEFNYALMASRINSYNIILKDKDGNTVASTISFSEGSKRFNVSPQQLLKPDSQYTLELGSSIASVDGDRLDEAIVYGFTTVKDVTPPVVTFLSSSRDVLPAESIIMQFNEQIDPGYLSASNFTLTPAVAKIKVDYNPVTREVRITPTGQQWSNATSYNLTVHDIRDLSGNIMPATNFAFTTLKNKEWDLIYTAPSQLYSMTNLEKAGDTAYLGVQLYNKLTLMSLKIGDNNVKEFSNITTSAGSEITLNYPVIRSKNNLLYLAFAGAGSKNINMYRLENESFVAERQLVSGGPFNALGFNFDNQGNPAGSYSFSNQTLLSTVSNYVVFTYNLSTNKITTQVVNSLYPKGAVINPSIFSTTLNKWYTSNFTSVWSDLNVRTNSANTGFISHVEGNKYLTDSQVFKMGNKIYGTYVRGSGTAAAVLYIIDMDGAATQEPVQIATPYLQAKTLKVYGDANKAYLVYFNSMTRSLNIGIINAGNLANTDFDTIPDINVNGVIDDSILFGNGYLYIAIKGQIDKLVKWYSYPL